MRNSSSKALGKVRLLAAATLVLAVLAGTSVTALAQEQPLRELPSVLGELRKGGFVIFFRHAATVESSATENDVDLARCDTQRNLSAEGRTQATEIGKSIKALRIPIGSVAASPFCRTKDTAQLAFGRFSVDSALAFVISTDARDTKRLADALANILSTPPEPGKNSVIVSHSANLKEAAGIFAKPEGAAYVFRPLGNGKFEPVARIPPQDWSALATSARTASGR